MQGCQELPSSKPPLNILVAVPYLTPELANLIRGRPEIRLLLDSGAFTVWKSGKEYPVDDYIRFVKELPFKPWRYFTLDKIGDPIGTAENLRIIRQAELDPIPIFTRGDEPDELERLYEGSDLVGIGGLVGTRHNAGFVRGIQQVVRHRQVHWLGFVRREFISAYKPFSCDSSSWLAPLRWGASLNLYLGQGRWRKITKQDFRTRPPEDLLSIIEEYGEDPARLRWERDWHRAGSGKNCLEWLCYKSWVRYSLDVEAKLGTKLFLATPSDVYCRLLLGAYDYWVQRAQKM